MPLLDRPSLKHDSLEFDEQIIRYPIGSAQMLDKLLAEVSNRPHERVLNEPLPEIAGRRLVVTPIDRRHAVAEQVPGTMEE